MQVPMNWFPENDVITVLVSPQGATERYLVKRLAFTSCCCEDASLYVPRNDDQKLQHALGISCNGDFEAAVL